MCLEEEQPETSKGIWGVGVDDLGAVEVSVATFAGPWELQIGMEPWAPALSLTVSSGKSLYLSGPHFSHLFKEVIAVFSQACGWEELACAECPGEFEPFRSGWAHTQAPASHPGPTANQHPSHSSCLGPWEPLPLCRGHKGQRPGRSGGKAEAGCEQAPGDRDLMMQSLMTQSRGGGAPLEEEEEEEGGGPATSCLSQDSLPRQGQLPHGVQA